MYFRITTSIIMMLVCFSTSAQTVGIAKREANNSFQETIWRRAQEMMTKEGLNFRIASADMDPKRQLAQVEDFYASGADAVILTLASTKGAEDFAIAAKKAHKSLIFVSTQPATEVLGDGVIYIGTKARESGAMQMTEVCRRMKGTGTIAILMGDLSSSAAKERMTGLHEVLRTSDCSHIVVSEEQSAGWSRSQAREVVFTWLAAGLKPDGILAGNDEMALGALDTLKDAGIKGVIVAGIDGSNDALLAVRKGDLAFTILQDGGQQGEQAVAAIRTIAAGGAVPLVTWLPYTFVMPEQATKLLAERGLK